MTPERVFVTGGDGFVGAHLLAALRERGLAAFGVGLRERAGFDRWWTLDVCDPAPLADALAEAKPDAVVHLAGQSSAARSFADPEGTFRANVIGTWSVLEAVRRAAPGARVLAVGTSEAYGPQPEDSRVSETAPFAPVSPYALSKAAADAMAEAYGRAHGLDVVRTRSFSHAGPGQAPVFALPSWAQQIAAAERGAAEPVLRVGNLEVVRDLTDVRDIVRAYLALIERGTGGEAYNVGSGAGTKLAEVARRLVSLARVPVRIEVDPERFRPADVPYLVADVTKMKRWIGWSPAIPLDRTLADVLDAARAG